jgi:hypothetical protein
MALFRKEMGTEKRVPSREISIWEEASIPSLKRIFMFYFRYRISRLHSLFCENPDSMNMENGFSLSIVMKG